MRHSTSYLMKRWIPFIKPDPVVAVIRLSGAIAAGGRGSLNDALMAPVIEKAFKRGKPKAVALLINSPGGSPVQSSLIAARIRRLAEEKEIPVVAFVEDVAASGGYWLASAADEIIADESSIIGSIGVISMGFGLNEFINRHGVERRVYTAGKSKSMLDPFQPEKPADVKRLKVMLEQIHGLIDGIGHLVPVMKERYGKKVRFARYGVKRSILQRFGARIVGDALDGIEERAHFARFGL